MEQGHKKTASRRLESQEQAGPQKSICWPKMLVGQELFDSPLATGHDAAEGEGWLKGINRLNPWGYDQELYKKRNEVERLFSRRKGFDRIFSRFDKLGLMFSAFWFLVLIVDSLRSC